MSIVGPRPMPLKYLNRFNAYEIKRLNTKPGITGLAQVSGRNNLSWEERFDLDVKYLQKNKVDVSVVSLSPPPWSTRDESLYFKGLKNIDWKVIDQSPVFKKVFQKMRIITVGTVPGNAANYSESRNSFKAKVRKFAQFFYTFLVGLLRDRQLRYVLFFYNRINQLQHLY